MSDITTTNLYSIDTFNTLIIDPLFRQSVVLNSGMTRVNTASTQVHLPVIEDGQAHWTAELAPLVDSEITPSMLVVTPAKLVAYSVISSEAANDQAAQQIVGQGLVSSLAKEVDQAFFIGDTNGIGPNGLANASVTDLTGDITELNPYMDAISELETEGASANAIYMHPRTWSKFAQTRPQTAPPAHMVGASLGVGMQAVGTTTSPVRTIAGVQVFASAGCPENVAYVADAARIAAVIRTDGVVETSRESEFGRDGVALRCITRLDWGFPYGKSIVRIA